MAAFDYSDGGFPASPATDDTLAMKGTTYKFNGSAWEVQTGGTTSFVYTATSGQTAFTGADSNSKTLAYTAASLHVFLNGVLLDAADYTATDGTTVTLGTGASTGDTLQVVAYGVLVAAGGGGGGSSPSNPTGLVSGRYYTGLFDSTANSAATLPTGYVFYNPVMVHEDCTIDELCLTIDGGTGNSGDLAQMAFYGPVPDDLNSVPHLVTTATFAVDSGYAKTISITPLTVTKGIYLYSVTTNTASLGIRRHMGASKHINHMVGVNTPSFQGGCYGAEWGTNTVSTWPHSFPSTINASQAAHGGDAWQFKYGVQ